MGGEHKTDGAKRFLKVRFNYTHRSHKYNEQATVWNRRALLSLLRRKMEYDMGDASGNLERAALDSLDDLVFAPKLGVL